jgi:hypothetical protein
MAKAKPQSRILKAARDAKRRAMETVKHADALLRAAQQKAATVARRRRVRQAIRQAGRALQTAAKAALAAGAAAALAAVVGEATRPKKRRGR